MVMERNPDIKNVIPFPLDDPPQATNLPDRDREFLQNLGIHVDHLDDLEHGRPVGADVIIFPKRPAELL